MRLVAYLLAAGLLAGSASTLAAEDRISQIEFFGHKGIDVDGVRRSLPVQEGDAFTPDVQRRVREAVVASLGKAPTDIQAVCCDEGTNRLLFIGLPGDSSRRLAYHPEPKGKARLPASVMDLYERTDAALEAAVRKGGDAASEDDSQGYALIKDPAARSLQLAVRQWAVKHQNKILQVLITSSDVKHRQVAADALGYALQSRGQLVGLAQAVRDPDSEVRNNATRALGVLCRANPGRVKEIPTASFIEMLSSELWTDRNKSAALLESMTARRDPALLEAIRENALDAVIEMASWRRAGHAAFARILLGRIAGLPEERLNELVWNGPVQAIIDAAVGSNPARPPSR